ncbi:hypothetical protein BGZ98_009822 [Dissophora globulifera]|nr:hypothetical protein BGZ98_009822 [Dissophora globulifera]
MHGDVSKESEESEGGGNEFEPITSPEGQRRGNYLILQESQIEQLIHRMDILLLSITKVAAMAKMSKTTAWRYHKRYREDPEELIPIKQTATKKPGPQAKFDSLKVSKTAVHRHIKEACRYSLKRVVPIVKARNSECILELQKNWVTSWQSREDEFLNMSVFIDEAVFNLQTLRSVGWAPNDERAAAEVPNHKGGRQRSLVPFPFMGLST